MADGPTTGSIPEAAREFAVDLRDRRAQLLDEWTNRMHASAASDGSTIVARTRDAAVILLDAILGRLSEEADEAADVVQVVERAIEADSAPADLERCLTVLRRIIDDHTVVVEEPDRRVEVLLAVQDQIDQLREEVSRAAGVVLQQRLQANEEKHRNLMLHADEAIFLCNPDDLMILEASRGAATLTGYDAVELSGMSLRRILLPNESDRVAAALAEALAGGVPVTIDDVHFLRQDESTIQSAIRGEPVQYGDRRALFVAARSRRDSIEAQELEENVLAYAGQLRRTVRQKSEQITALTRIATSISSGSDLDKVLQIVIFEIGKLVDFDFLCVVMVDDAGETYRVVSAAGDPISELSHGSVMPFASSIFEAVTNDRKLQAVNDLEEEQHGTESKLLFERGMRSCVCLPLMSGQRAIGGLYLASRSTGAYSSRDVAILNEIADQVVVASECSRLSAIEKRRSAELAIINEVGREAISTLDLRGLLKSAAVSIQKNFAYFDVSIFLVDWKAGDVVLTAQAGDYGDMSTEGYRQRIGVGLVGWAAEHGETVVANDVSREPRRIIAFDGERAAGSELCVPIMIGGLAEGVINVECRETNSFDESSVSALETLADLISRAIENALLFQNARSLTEFNERIIAMIPSMLIVLDQELRVVLVNDEYCKSRSVEKSEVEGRHVTGLFDSQLIDETDLNATLERVLETGNQVALPALRHRHRERVEVLNIHISHIGEGQEPRVVMIIEDVTETVEHAYRLSMLRQINAAIQGALQLDKILRLVLTCVTAGRGLGFNRAILLMVNSQKSTLEGWTGDENESVACEWEQATHVQDLQKGDR